MKYVQNICSRNIYVLFKFSCVRSSHGLCARAQLRGNIGSVPNISFVAEKVVFLASVVFLTK